MLFSSLVVLVGTSDGSGRGQLFRFLRGVGVVVVFLPLLRSDEEI